MPEVTLHEPKRKPVSSGSLLHEDPAAKSVPQSKARAFSRQRSRNRPDLSTATTTVFENTDGTFTAEIHRAAVNRPDSAGGWVPDKALTGSATQAASATTLAAAVTNPTGQRTTSDSTYVKSGVNENFSSDNALYVGTHDGHNYNSFIKFDGFATQFQNAYILNANLYLDTEFGDTSAGFCQAAPVSVAPVTSSWNPATLKSYPGPSSGTAIGSSTFMGGVNCQNGRVWAGIALKPRTFTNWAHGWAPNYGLAITAPYTATAWKEFNPDDAYLAIEYAADGAGASYSETLYASPWNNKTGWAKVTIQNEGSATWTPTNGYKLGYQIYTVANGARTLYSTSNYLTAMPRNVAPNTSVTVTATLPALSPGETYQVCWDMVHNGQYFSGLGIPQACYALDVVNNPPVIDSLFPYNNSTQYSLTPKLYMTAHDVDAYPNTGLKYTYNLYINGSATVLATSGTTTSASWTVPAGKLSWGSTYYWRAQVTDGTTASAWSQPGYFSVPAPPQPLVTSHLGAASASSTVNGASATAGNYSTEVVDASSPAGLAAQQLEIRRTYNSMDPRLENAFGAGWSSLLDSRLIPDNDGTSSVVVVLPNGREERFGLNADGSYTSPPGARQKLVQTPAGSGHYQLRDPSGLVYEFANERVDSVSGQTYVSLQRVVDGNGRAVSLSYDTFEVAGADGVTASMLLPSSIIGGSEKRGAFGSRNELDFSWGAASIVTGSGRMALAPHVSKVSLVTLKYGLGGKFRVREWTYGYDAANNLTSVCPPDNGAACTGYSYTSGSNSGSHFSAMVTDASPLGYWRLTDAGGTTRAVDQVAANVGTFDAMLTSVTLGQPGALPGTPATSAAFNGTSSKMSLPNDLVSGSNMTVGMWFKTTQAGGTLFSYQSQPAGTAAPVFTPALYIGTEGKLHGKFWDGSATPQAVTTKAVNDGKWHYAVLAGASTKQKLYLDGAEAASLSGATIASSGQPYVTVGAGRCAGGWAACPTNNSLGWFAGQIQDVFYINKPLGLPAIQQQYAAGITAARELVTAKLPSGKTAAVVTYDALADRVNSVTTGDGGTTRFSLPSTSGSTNYYRGAVLSTRPILGYPLNEESGTVARNLLGLNPSTDDHQDGVYNDVVLGVPGIFGDDGDTAASFNGSSSYLSLPPGSVDVNTSASVGLWFRTKTAGGVLFSYQNTPINDTVPQYFTPLLYIGTDGKLRGQQYDGTASPITSLAAVNDGNWHMALITAAGATQKLWLDGVAQGTRTGSAARPNAAAQNVVAVGAGYLGGGWPSRPATAGQSRFNGDIAQVAVYSLDIDQITPGVAAYLFQAKGSAMSPMPTTTVTITDPNNATSTVAMDPVNGMRITAVTNALGQTTAYTYDTLGNRVGITDPAGHSISRVFDKNGNAVQETTCQTAKSCQTTNYTFYWDNANLADPRNGKILTKIDARAGTSGAANTTYRTTYAYTATGDVASVITPPTTEAPNGRKTTYSYTTADSKTFDSAVKTTEPGLLESVTDPRGQKTVYGYDEFGMLRRVVEASGLTREYLYNALRSTVQQVTVTSDTYPNGVRTIFNYDDRNRLTSQLGPTTTDAVTERTHTPHVILQYDVDGNITKQAAEDWGQLEDQYLAHDPDFVDDRITSIKASVPGQSGLDAPRSTSFTYNAGNRIETLTDPLGNVTRHSYDTNGWNTESTTPDGNVYRNTYSGVGEVLTTTLTGWIGDPNAPSTANDLVLESRAYDPAGRLASVTDAMGRTTAYTYFDDDRLESVTKAASTPDAIVAARYGYDAAGHLISECLNATNAGCARQVNYTVDNADRITGTVIDPAGLKTSITSTFDNNDNVLTQTLTGAGASDSRRRIYTYDTAGRLATSSVDTGAQTITTKNTYDQRGLLTSQIDPRGNLTGATPSDFTTSYRYDEVGRQIAVSSPPVKTENEGGTAVKAVATVLTGYNTFGEQVETKSPTGKIQANTYDVGGRLTASAWAAYTAPGTSTTVTPVVRYAYDKLGQLITQTDPFGNEQSYQYDQLGNRVTQTLQDGRTTRITYDTVGEALSVTNPLGARSEATYNALGQTVTATQIERGTPPAAYTTSYGYDAAGHLTSVKDPLGKTVHRTYNGVDLLTAETDALGNESTTDYNYAGQPTRTTAADGTATTYAYDLAGRLTSSAQQDANSKILRTNSFDYDVAGNQTSTTDPLGKTITTTYDARNRIVSQVQPSTPGQTITTSFGYDADGNTTRYTDPNNNATTYTFNNLGLPESTMVPAVAGQTAAADRTTYLRYDVGGRQTSITRPGNVTIAYTYDKTGRLITESGSGAEAVTETRTYGYDAADHLTTATDPTSTSAYTYGDRGLMRTASMAGWDTTFNYDDAGRLIGQTDPSGITRYGYDDANRQTSQTDPITGKTVTFAYDKVGQATGVSYGDGGPTRTYSYDPLHQLKTDVLKNAGGEIMASVAYGYDDAGHLTSKTTAGVAGAGSNTYTYDDAGRLASWTAGAVTTPYTYDSAGNRTRAGPTSYTYNARSQLTSATTGSTNTAYSYTSRGTTSAITSGSTTTAIASDAFDQQITAGAARYDYDALGRVATRVDGNTTRTFNYQGQSNNVVNDGTQIFGRTVGGTPLSAKVGGTASFLNVDQHGDVTGTFAADGTSLSSSATYDPYGKVTNAAGTRVNLGYQGGWTDPTTNFVNAASRWYNPGTGGFTSADTQQNPPTPAVNANPYAYGNDDPLSHADPTGHDACGTYNATVAAMKAAIYAGLHPDWRKFWLSPLRKQAIGPPVERNTSGGGGNGGSGSNPSSGNADAGSGGSSTSSNNGSGYTGGSSSWGSLYEPPTYDASDAWNDIKSVATNKTFWNAAGTVAFAVGATASVLYQSMFGLAAGKTASCVSGNAPEKPKQKAKGRSKGPVKATGATGNADRAPGQQAQQNIAPGEDPSADASSISSQPLPSEDDCFQGAYQRTDGSRSGGMWVCDSPDFVTDALEDIKGDYRTTGRLFDQDGNLIDEDIYGGPIDFWEVTSGDMKGSTAQAASRYLHQHANTNGVPPQALYPASSDVETKFAWLIRVNSRRLPGTHFNVVINHPRGPCPYDGYDKGCMQNTEAILPPGYSMDIWYPGPIKAPTRYGRGLLE